MDLSDLSYWNVITYHCQSNPIWGNWPNSGKHRTQSFPFFIYLVKYTYWKYTFYDIKQLLKSSHSSVSMRKLGFVCLKWLKQFGLHWCTTSNKHMLDISFSVNINEELVFNLADSFSFFQENVVLFDVFIIFWIHLVSTSHEFPAWWGRAYCTRLHTPWCIKTGSIHFYYFYSIKTLTLRSPPRFGPITRNCNQPWVCLFHLKTLLWTC